MGTPRFSAVVPRRYLLPTKSHSLPIIRRGGRALRAGNDDPRPRTFFGDTMFVLDRGSLVSVGLVLASFLLGTPSTVLWLISVHVVSILTLKAVNNLGVALLSQGMLKEVRFYQSFGGIVCLFCSHRAFKSLRGLYTGARLKSSRRSPSCSTSVSCRFAPIISPSHPASLLDSSSETP